MLKTTALTMCSAMGYGAVKKRAFASVMSAPRASSARRAVPATEGTRLNPTSAAGTSHSDFVHFMGGSGESSTLKGHCCARRFLKCSPTLITRSLRVADAPPPSMGVNRDA